MNLYKYMISHKINDLGGVEMKNIISQFVLMIALMEAVENTIHTEESNQDSDLLLQGV